MCGRFSLLCDANALSDCALLFADKGVQLRPAHLSGVLRWPLVVDEVLLFAICGSSPRPSGACQLLVNCRGSHYTGCAQLVVHDVVPVWIGWPCRASYADPVPALLACETVQDFDCKAARSIAS